MNARPRKIWGWGYEGDGFTDEEIIALGATLATRFGLEVAEPTLPPRIEDLRLRAPRVRPPTQMASWCSISARDRAEHTLGQSFDDLARGLRGQYDNPPDIVAVPSTEQHIEQMLDWCGRERLALIPYGGGSSVVRGIEPIVGPEFRGAVTLDLRRFDQVLDIDRESRSARIQSGIYGPALESQLKPHGLTLRHFPQSFEMSTLGGWIATRSGGHYATLFTHIDEFVQGLRVLTPSGLYETRRLPGSGAGPDPARLVVGSEGILGVITEAWMRLQERPRFRAGAVYEFSEFADACGAAREIAQSGLWPANCRVLDQTERLLSGSGDGEKSALIVSFESPDHPVDAWLARAGEICGGRNGVVQTATSDGDGEVGASRSGTAGLWRDAFIAGAHRHDAVTRLGLVYETFETAITWNRFHEFHSSVMQTARRAAEEVCGPGAIVACRLAYAYPDGPAPYYTVVGAGKAGSQVEQWSQIKAAVSEVLVDCGGTITHHHAVGRYHRRWYDRERPELFADALRAARRTLDPAGIMNPGVLIGPG